MLSASEDQSDERVYARLSGEWDSADPRLRDELVGFFENPVRGASPLILEMYWDLGSTNTYFALKLIEPILDKTGAELLLHPFNLGYVFRAHNYALMDEPRAKLSNRRRDLWRWAQRYDLPFRMPDVFPIKTSRALRGAIAMRRWGLEKPFIEAMFTAYWENNDANVATYPGLRLIAEELEVHPDEFEEASESMEVRQELIDSTNTGMERGVFGAPSMLVGDELFWGKDRMEFVEAVLLGNSP